jgi:hypothetical protein
MKSQMFLSLAISGLLTSWSAAQLEQAPRWNNLLIGKLIFTLLGLIVPRGVGEAKGKRAYEAARYSKTCGFAYTGPVPTCIGGLEVSQERVHHSSNDIANMVGFFDRLIPRESLRPGYGEGWNPL